VRTNPRSIPKTNWPWPPPGHTTSGGVRMGECPPEISGLPYPAFRRVNAGPGGRQAVPLRRKALRTSGAKRTTLVPAWQCRARALVPMLGITAWKRFSATCLAGHLGEERIAKVVEFRLRCRPEAIFHHGGTCSGPAWRKRRPHLAAQSSTRLVSWDSHNPVQLT